MTHNYCQAMTREDFIRLVGSKNVSEYLYQEFQNIWNLKTEGTFKACLAAAVSENKSYGERLCFDHNRVVLSEERGVTNFINASYINGFQQPKAYIATQTPYSEATVCKFWKMVWEHQSETIVMLNKSVYDEEGIYYWNPEEGGTFHCEKFRIETLEVQSCFQAFQLTKLRVTHVDGNELVVDHFLFKNWQDEYISPPKHDFLELVKMVQSSDQWAVKQDSATSCKNPMVIHCSDGIGRTMAFCAIDIEISRFLKTKRVDPYSTLSELKKNRFDSFSSIDDAIYLCYTYFVLYTYFQTYTIE